MPNAFSVHDIDIGHATKILRSIAICQGIYRSSREGLVLSFLLSVQAYIPPSAQLSFKQNPQ